MSKSLFIIETSFQIFQRIIIKIQRGYPIHFHLHSSNQLTFIVCNKQTYKGDLAPRFELVCSSPLFVCPIFLPFVIRLAEAGPKVLGECLCTRPISLFYRSNPFPLFYPLPLPSSGFPLTPCDPSSYLAPSRPL